MIKELTIKTLQKAINHALSLDETSMPKLQALQGKVLEIVIAPLNVRFFIYFSQGELQLLPEYNGHIDTVIHSSPLGLIRLSLLPASKVRSLFNDQIKVSGDVELGHQIKKLFDELDIDWEGHLAQFTGDVVAYQVGSFFRQGFALKERTTASLRQNMTEYLQEELRILPPREEIEDFFKDIDELSLRVERLAAHINHLRARYETD
ncbi:ubiquinone biosynthesis accessory factor UbiJ [Legionella nagasakiensis]|uniref:ubiquinone biosynthesis accessory factor UbiJ n=1 Tax=Legionella nagasakiensis TaxID=535290 RepID=UPI0010550193|nr:SCP2 sterol-binding domain-containing protein [Legionella nagasakiensis]